MGERHGLNLNSVEARPYPGGKDGWMHGNCTVEGCDYTASAPRLDGLIGRFEEHERGKREAQRTYHPTDQDVRDEVRRMRDATQRTPLRQRALELIEHEARRGGPVGEEQVTAKVHVVDGKVRVTFPKGADYLSLTSLEATEFAYALIAVAASMGRGVQ